MAVYAAQVGATDRGLGRLLQVLEDGGKIENTLVMFLPDNGAAPDAQFEAWQRRVGAE